jgi:hypothetical protein
LSKKYLAVPWDRAMASGVKNSCGVLDSSSWETPSNDAKKNVLSLTIGPPIVAPYWYLL